MISRNDRLVWIDLEMSGLNYTKDVILEIASIITNNELEIVAEGPNLIIHHSDEVLENMDPWCVVQHKKTGLTDSVKKSKVTMFQAEYETLKFLQQYCKQYTAPLCGNSVWFDKLFLQKEMPNLAAFFNYRVVDVSSFKIMISRWSNQKTQFEKKANHRALDDIKESIEELKFYKKKFLCNL